MGHVTGPCGEHVHQFAILQYEVKLVKKAHNF